MSSGMKLMDRAFYFTESDNSPKHVAGLLKFTIPEGKDYHYVLELYETLRTFDKAEAPFNQTVVSYFKIPFWFQEQTAFDRDYHIKIHEVENVDDIIELNTLVVKLHEERLDKSKPLWQCHLIYCKKS
ncbi:MAG: diacylglycerol O-acyltransferase, partial [Cognaticolwellia sp.]